MAQQAQEIEVPSLPFEHCSTEEHCRALRKVGTLPFWWYQDFAKVGGNFSLPFQDNLGAWWYQVRPGYAWPAGAVDELPSRRRVPYLKTFLAYQHVTPPGEPTNSSLVINTILDVPGYSTASLDDKRRNAVRKGLRSCDVIAIDKVQDDWLPGVMKAWNDLVERTGWKHQRDAAFIRDSWSRLLDLPGTKILLAIDKATSQVAGFLITKVHGTTAYVDTIASNSDLLKSNPNDALMFTFIRNVQRLPAVSVVHYAIKSSVEHLERFKTSLGFAPNVFPANLHARPGMMTLLKTFKPEMYKRLTGQLDADTSSTSTAPTTPST